MDDDRVNIFMKDRKHDTFRWEYLGDIAEGRSDLGSEMPVLIYRLMQYTMLDILSKEYGLEKANGYFRKAGFISGTEFANNMLDLKADFNLFVSNLQQYLENLKIGILRMEEYDPESGDITLTVGQDLDCSGLPVTYENVCTYDEGFLSGIFEAYMGKKYNVREVDCWANGDRVCRFNGSVVDGK